jgi:hypothetical protein
VVGPARVSRRHERPSRMVVSRRSGTSRPPRWAARLQARVGSGSASPPPVAPTVLASALSVVPVWPGGPCAGWPTPPMLPGWEASGRGHWAQLRRDPRPLPHRARERHQAKVRYVPGGSSWWWRLAPIGCAAAALRGRVAHAPDRRTARSLTTFVASTQLTAGRTGVPLRLGGGDRHGTYGPDEAGRSPVVGWADSCHTVAWFTAGRRWRCKVPGDCSCSWR